ncbi:MAG TPA: glutamine--tRNA ligase/YqeY domain fusion protein [Gammaproteobacteria bacterium]|nr:glutamine--tRNA ligase/YqeY domain fusion protein [Gammaproteobacteria bacterium]HJN00994.1 glutamine--tRNA ligase/YqeY domain fusion protein [Gammaproteobacteria bacterium]|tara:strand:+ start:31509 stop:33176 length:1668 start_codon:yes stop_codon:yes gene_type:complete
MSKKEKYRGKDFIRQMIHHDIDSGINDGRLATRFPPEPNGYLHIGHALSICINFGIAKEFDAPCYLRFDDTNPAKESEEYVNSIMEDVKWLGFDWGNNLAHASDYFGSIHELALELIEKDLAYVDSQTSEELKNTRGTLNTPGTKSPYRDRSIAENLGLFERMKNGEFENGEHVLRAKIDMSSPNINLRDPIIYRILHMDHQKTGGEWCIYPMYDFAHTLSDALEGTTHSLCTLEFEDHRPLYEWFLDNLSLPTKPRQIEFSRLNVEHTITSKRKLAELIDSGHVEGWDDPRMPTISGLRKRGYPASAIREFCRRVGITKKDKSIEMSLLESTVREQLDASCNRAMAILKPLKITIKNYPEGETEILEAKNHPKNEEMGSRELPFSQNILIEKDDFMENPDKDFFRLSPGSEVRLRYAYIIKCEEVIKNENNEIVELICSYDPDTKSGSGTSTKKVKSAIHWVSENHSIGGKVNLFETLYTDQNPKSDSPLNPDSIIELDQPAYEQSLSKAKIGSRFQFERNGYFIVDQIEGDELIFNRIVTLKDTWAKIQKKKK